jgi:hypothetical protein
VTLVQSTYARQRILKVGLTYFDDQQVDRNELLNTAKDLEVTGQEPYEALEDRARAAQKTCPWKGNSALALFPFSGSDPLSQPSYATVKR